MLWRARSQCKVTVFFETLFTPLAEGQQDYSLPPDIGPSCCNPAHMKVWKEGMPKPYAGVKMCKKGHIIDENNMITENRQGHPIARCRICRQEAWRIEKRRARNR